MLATEYCTKLNCCRNNKNVFSIQVELNKVKGIIIFKDLRHCAWKIAYNNYNNYRTIFIVLCVTFITQVMVPFHISLRK